MRHTKFLCEFQLKLFALVFFFPHLIIRPGEVPLCRVAEDGQSKMNEYLEYKNDYIIFNIFWYSIFENNHLILESAVAPDQQARLVCSPVASWYELFDRCIVSWPMISFIHVTRTIIVTCGIVHQPDRPGQGEGELARGVGLSRPKKINPW